MSAFHSPPSCRVTTVPSTTVPYSSPGCLCRPVLTPGSHSVVISVKTLSGMPVTGASATSTLTLTCCASADADPRSKAMAHTVAKHRITASQSLLGRGNLRLSIGRPDYAHQSYTHLTRDLRAEPERFAPLAERSRYAVAESHTAVVSEQVLLRLPCHLAMTRQVYGLATFSCSGRGNCRPQRAAASTASRPLREYPPRC